MGELGLIPLDHIFALAAEMMLGKGRGRTGRTTTTQRVADNKMNFEILVTNDGCGC